MRRELRPRGRFNVPINENRPLATCKRAVLVKPRPFWGHEPGAWPKALALTLALRRLVARRGGRSVAVLRHERVDLCLALRVTQTGQELLDHLLPDLEAPQRVRPVVIEG